MWRRPGGEGDYRGGGSNATAPRHLAASKTYAQRGTRP
jgi:hypothetical protein